MGVRGILATMVGGSALAIVVAVTQCEPRHASEPDLPSPAPAAPATPAWLTDEARLQLLRPGGHLGPLFEDVILGGPAPSAAVRDRIAAFGRTHDVAIDLDVVDGLVLGVRLDVLFRGIGGEEGADVFALRLQRPRQCLDCGGSWFNDWAYVESGEYVRVRIRVNRVQVRWERPWTIAEVLAFADGLVGADSHAIEVAHPDRWKRDDEPGRYRREVPYVIDPLEESGPRLGERGRFGMRILAPTGRITEVSFTIHAEPGDRTDLEGKVRKHWGRPRIDDGTLVWKLRDRTIEAYGVGPDSLKITMSAR